MKIAVVSNREDNNTLFTKKDDIAWKAISLALYRELQKPYWKDKELLIPIYSRFDREVLRNAILNHLNCVLYLPSSDWGDKYLPEPQLYIVARAKEKYPSVICNGNQQRLEQMSLDCDGVYTLRTKDKLDFNESYLAGKPEYRFNLQEALNVFQEVVAKKNV